MLEESQRAHLNLSLEPIQSHGGDGCCDDDDDDDGYGGPVYDEGDDDDDDDDNSSEAAEVDLPVDDEQMDLPPQEDDGEEYTAAQTAEVGGNA